MQKKIEINEIKIVNIQDILSFELNDIFYTLSIISNIKIENNYFNILLILKFQI